ncbi:hypothetical protein [Methanogenium cariaci]|uniref:hypothetical protein n=1 Tax=Methanogenium cariaci TaxID=2197 RepID=UPI00155DC9CF|nr:hypothetical protein [Methanogenium cariaci]
MVQERGEFTTPLGIAVDRSGTIYVADTNNNRIQTFEQSDVLPASSGNATHPGSVPPPTTSPPVSVLFVIPGIMIALIPVGVFRPSDGNKK